MNILFIAEIFNRGRLREQLIIEAKDDTEAKIIAQDHAIIHYHNSLKTIKVKVIKPITILKDNEYATPFLNREEYFCPVNGCDNFISANGFCGMHYAQMRKYKEIHEAVDAQKMKDRELVIRELKRRGKTFQEIGELFGITFQRVEEIYKKWK